MADHPRFGPAGVPPIFKILGAKSFDVPKLLRQEGLDAFEYQAVRWGQKPQIKKQDAVRLGFEARKNNVMLSMHGSYYINLSGKKETVEASKRRVIAWAKAAEWMNASVLVFHAGFYGLFEKDYAFRTCVKELKDIVATMKSEGIRNVNLGPETMGRVFQIGSLDEILTICEESNRPKSSLTGHICMLDIKDDLEKSTISAGLLKKSKGDLEQKLQEPCTATSAKSSTRTRAKDDITFWMKLDMVRIFKCWRR
jgi:endonuclease IV